MSKISYTLLILEISLNRLSFVAVEFLFGQSCLSVKFTCDLNTCRVLSLASDNKNQLKFRFFANFFAITVGSKPASYGKKPDFNGNKTEVYGKGLLVDRRRTVSQILYFSVAKSVSVPVPVW